MKTRDNGWIVGLLLLGAPWTPAEATVLDSFSEGEFHLESGGQQLARSDISSPLVSTRRVQAYGIGPWSVDLASGSGVLICNVTDTGPPPGQHGFFGIDFYYAAAGNPWSLSGYDAIVIDFLEVTGMARLHVRLNPSDPVQITPVAVVSAGELSYPIANTGATSLDEIAGMQVFLIPESDTFSFSLNEIAAVPEPSIVVLLLGLPVCLVGRRNGNC
jgi:hypothetical protein